MVRDRSTQGVSSLPNVPATNPPGANFYPEDIRNDEFESWVKTLPEQEKAQALVSSHRSGAKGQQNSNLFLQSGIQEDLARPAELLNELPHFMTSQSLHSNISYHAGWRL